MNTTGNDIFDLAGEQGVFIPATLVRFCEGNASTAALLAQCLFWTDRSAGGWFYKTQDKWEAEVGIERRRQETARKWLKERGYLEEQLKGLPRKVWFRVNTEKLAADLRVFSTEDCKVLQHGGKRHTVMAESAIQACTEAPSSDGEKRQTVMAESAKHKSSSKKPKYGEPSGEQVGQESCAPAATGGKRPADVSIAPAGRADWEFLPSTFRGVEGGTEEDVLNLLASHMGKTPAQQDVDTLGLALEQLPKLNLSALREASERSVKYGRTAKVLAFELGKQFSTYIKLDGVPVKGGEVVTAQSQSVQQEEVIPDQQEQVECSQPKVNTYPAKITHDLRNQLDEVYQDDKGSLFERFGIPVVLTYLSSREGDMEQYREALQKMFADWKQTSGGKQRLKKAADRSIMQSPYPAEFEGLNWRDDFPIFRELFGKEVWWREIDYTGQIASGFPALLKEHQHALAA